jgi:exopolyphosphatase/guanosine-5'-triphosphate,3'-diphosphate pyrophosphatase
MADFNPPDERRSAAATRQDGLPIPSRHARSDSAGDRQGNGAFAERAQGRQPHDQPRPGPRQAYAAIDLGTNNCRLLIARPRTRISW